MRGLEFRQLDTKDLPRNNSPDSAAAGHCQRRCSAVEYGRILASRALLAATIHTLGLGRGISRQTLSGLSMSFTGVVTANTVSAS
jgi:hypothetical protein